ncbi:hypothetical protein Ddye_024651 [Dipteronia dyeriana]|uniref:TIR domain-containing protein n=1 Tax=Dipteronia dyeriana TaxID=168575 RepID=A0AAD9WUE0_9ROSI|nr:hypothetical protein Ddye_024651 [Dipteronia dyeriana]
MREYENWKAKRRKKEMKTREDETCVQNYQLIKGDEISPSLLTAIEESRISIVFFSKDYASSTWCLQELVRILECSQIVIPVFHGINPSDVRKQTGTFQDAFAKHEQVFGYKSEKLQRWRTALTKAANLSGWDSSIIRVEYVLVNRIVKDVLGKLEYLSSITKLVGIESIVNFIESSLCTGSNDFRSLGICGIGSIGKTILAKAVYNKIACQFEGSYFIDNVRPRLEAYGRFRRLANGFLYMLLGGGNVNELFHDEAFSRYAFKQNHPPVEYMEQSNKMVSHTGRVPLALTVLGSMLREREKPEWETVLSKITSIIDSQTYDVLKLSYDELGSMEKELFPDIACFFYHEDIYGVLKENTGTGAVEGISLDMSKIRNIQLDPGAFSKMTNLSFLKFYSSANEMNSKVHLVQDTELPSRRLSYFFWHAYPLKSLPSNFYTEKLRVLHLPCSNLEQLSDAGYDMSILLVHIFLSYILYIKSLISEGCTSLLEIPSSIRYLDKLITLNLRDCKSLKSFPTYIYLKSLKILILSGCSNLNKFPGMLGNVRQLTCLPNGICKLKCLEELNLTGCSKLGRLPHDLGNLKPLKKLKVSGTGVREVPPSIACSIKSGTLSFERCQGQELMGLQLSSLSRLYDMTNLVLRGGCNIKELPESLGSLSSIKMLSLCRNNFESIPESIIKLSNLILLNISYCERLKSLPILPRDLKLVAHNCTSLEAFSGLTVPFTHRPYTLITYLA